MNKDELQAWVFEKQVEAIVEHCSKITSTGASVHGHSPFDEEHRIDLTYDGGRYAYSMVPVLGTPIERIHEYLRHGAKQYLLEELGWRSDSRFRGCSTDFVFDVLTKERY